MAAGVQLVEDIVDRFPELWDICDAHEFNEGCILPHAIFWDITQEVGKAFVSQDSEARDWRGILEFLDGKLETGDREVVEVIVTSFMHYMPYPGQPGYLLAEEFGPCMSQRFGELRSGIG